MASLVIVFGSYAAALLTQRVLAQRSLKAEAAHFWQRHASDQAQAAPDTLALRGWFVPMGGSAVGVPRHLRPLQPGLHRLNMHERLVLVDARDSGRLYLVYSQSRLDWLLFWVVLGPVLLSLLAVLASSQFTYRILKRQIVPVNRLADEVARWDPGDPDISMLAPDRLPTDAGVETRQLSGALYRMADRMRAFVARERDFTRDASHELRTPLTVIRVASDLLAGDPDMPSRAQRSLGRIQRAGRDMESVIDAFLILARETDVVVAGEEFSVREVVDEAIENARSGGKCKDKQVELRVVESGKPRLHAPAGVLRVMLGNLLGNACTFTDEGRIEVRIFDDRLEVHDTGIGMDAETLERAFEPFWRVDFSTSPGKGMGLSIVRRLGERFGWPVTLRSELGEGTVATIHFGGTGSR